MKGGESTWKLPAMVGGESVSVVVGGSECSAAGGDGVAGSGSVWELASTVVAVAVGVDVGDVDGGFEPDASWTGVMHVGRSSEASVCELEVAVVVSVHSMTEFEESGLHCSVAEHEVAGGASSVWQLELVVVGMDSSSVGEAELES